MLNNHPASRIAVRVLIAGLVAVCAALAGFALASSGAATGGVGATESKAKSAPKAKSKAKAKAKATKERADTRFKLSRKHLNLGQRVKLHGLAKPGGRRAFKVVVRGPEGDVVRRKTNRRGKFTRAWRPAKPGVYRLSSYAGHNGRAKGSRGPSRRLTVYRPAFSSWFGPGFYGNRTACGQILSPGMLGVAHKTMPCGTKLKLRYKGRKAAVRVIDRGPYIGGREFDLTWATKQKLRFGDLGTVYSSK